MNKKIKVLSEWYLELYENDNGFKFNGLSSKTHDLGGPNICSDLSNYIINQLKPKPKIIDLKMMVGVDIDIEFYGYMSRQWRVGNLKKMIKTIDGFNYYIDLGKLSCKCRIRENHWHSWQGGDCPLPKGLTLIIRQWHKNGPYNEKCLSTEWIERKYRMDNIIAFMVIGKQDGYIYEWE